MLAELAEVPSLSPSTHINKQISRNCGDYRLNTRRHTVGPWGSLAGQLHRTDQLQAQGEVLLKTEVKFRVGEVAQQLSVLLFPGTHDGFPAPMSAGS